MLFLIIVLIILIIVYYNQNAENEYHKSLGIFTKKTKKTNKYALEQKSILNIGREVNNDGFINDNLTNTSWKCKFCDLVNSSKESFCKGCKKNNSNTTDYVALAKECSTGQPTFRKAVWGMRKEQVLRLEDLALVEENPELLSCQGTIAGLNSYICYSFVENILVRGTYLIKEIHANENKYILDYENIKGIISKKYGKPMLDEKVWSDNLYKHDPDKWGFALTTGRLSLMTEWKTNDTLISLALIGDNYKITSFVVQYQSLKLENLIKSLEMKKSLEDF